MSISEQERHDVHKWFEEAMGPERAANLMSLLPPVGWADVATKRDLDALEDRLRAHFAVVDERFLRSDATVERLVAELRTEMAKGFTLQTRLMVSWMLGIAGAVTAAAALIA